MPAVADVAWVDLDGERLFEHGGEAPPPETAAAPELRDGGTRVLIPLQDFGTLGLATTADARTTPTTSRSWRSSPGASRSCWPTPGS